MQKTVEKAGNKYNDWTASDFSHCNDVGKQLWFYFCVCGKRKAVLVANVQRGLSKNCGCSRKKGLSERSKTHGLAKSPIYNSWAAMKSRCDLPSNKVFEHYGGRGITYCAKWATFDGFAEDMLPTWKKGLSIERIDNSGNYEKGNCRWATIKEQANNKRSNVLIKCPDGVTRVLKAASDLFGIPYNALYQRFVTYGWPESDCFKAVQRRGRQAKTIPEGDPK